MRYGTYGTQIVSSNTDASIWLIVSLLVAICGGIVLYFTFLNPNNAKNYTGWTKKIYDFLSFTTLSLEAILKICYLILAIYITITSFSVISTSFIAFLLYLIIGNVIIRLIFEGALLILMLYRKVSDISEKLSAKEFKKTETKKLENNK